MIGKYNTDIAAFLAEVKNVTTGTAAEEDSQNKATIEDSVTIDNDGVTMDEEGQTIDEDGKTIDATNSSDSTGNSADDATKKKQQWRWKYATTGQKSIGGKKVAMSPFLDDYNYQDLYLSSRGQARI